MVFNIEVPQKINTKKSEKILNLGFKFRIEDPILGMTFKKSWKSGDCVFGRSDPQLVQII